MFFSGEHIVVIAPPQGNVDVETYIKRMVGECLDVPCFSIRSSRLWPDATTIMDSTIPIILQQIPDDEWKSHRTSNDTCFNCFDSCWDAAKDNTSDNNCIRCSPYSLCTGCRVYIENEPVCLACFTPQEISKASANKKRRAILCGNEGE